MAEVSGQVTAQRLMLLARLYQEGQVSPLMARTLDKLLAHEAEECQGQLRQLNADLAEFEQQYALSSSAFYQRFRAGQTDDRMDYVEWASLVQMRDNLQKRLHLLTDEASQDSSARVANPPNIARDIPLPWQGGG